MKDKIEEILSQDINAHPSREDQERIRRLERIVLILAEEIDKKQSEPTVFGPGIVQEITPAITNPSVCTAPCVYGDLGTDGINRCVNCGQPKVIFSIGQ